MRQHEEGLRRDYRIPAEIFEKFGYTADCAGCEAKILGTDHRNHSTECRKRVEKEMQRDGKMKETLKRRNKRVQLEPSPEAAASGWLPSRHDQDGDEQMETPGEETVNPRTSVFLDEDGLEYSKSGKPLRLLPAKVVGPATASSAAASSGASSSQESGREVEVPDNPRQQQKLENAAPSNLAKKQRSMLLEKSAKHVMNVIMKEHGSDELCGMEAF